MSSSLPPISGYTRAGTLQEIAALQAGSRPAADRWFSEAVHPHEPALRAYLRRRFPGITDIDDVIQEAYARLFRTQRIGELREIRPYLFATARNAAVDICRRKQPVFIKDIAESRSISVVEDRPSAAELLSHAEEIELLHEAIDALPERCREVFALRKLHGFSHREIAEKLGISENTIEGQISIGIFRCRQYLAQCGVPLERFKRGRKEA